PRIDHLKAGPRGSQQRLDLAQHEKPTRLQYVVELLEQLLLNRPVQIDDHISAQNQMLTRRRAVADQVGPFESHPTSEPWIDAMGRTGREPSLPPLGRRLGHR